MQRMVVKLVVVIAVVGVELSDIVQVLSHRNEKVNKVVT